MIRVIEHTPFTGFVLRRLSLHVLIIIRTDFTFLINELISKYIFDLAYN